MGEPRGSQGATSIESENVSRPPEETLGLRPSSRMSHRMSTRPGIKPDSRPREPALTRSRSPLQGNNTPTRIHTVSAFHTQHQHIKITPTKMKTTMPSVDTWSHAHTHSPHGGRRAVALGNLYVRRVDMLMLLEMRSALEFIQSCADVFSNVERRY
jgi:hypothetical protein